MNFDLIVKARKVLEPLWLIASLKGRCWGPIRKDNPFGATNITFFIGCEGVTIAQHPEGLAIYGFRMAGDTKLAKQVKGMLIKAGLPIEGMKLAEIPFIAVPEPPFYFGDCPVCKTRYAEEYQDGDDSLRALRHLFEKHTKASPDCVKTNLKIYNHLGQELKELEEMISHKAVA